MVAVFKLIFLMALSVNNVTGYKKKRITQYNNSSNFGLSSSSSSESHETKNLSELTPLEAMLLDKQHSKAQLNSITELAAKDIGSLDRALDGILDVPLNRLDSVQSFSVFMCFLLFYQCIKLKNVKTKPKSLALNSRQQKTIPVMVLMVFLNFFRNIKPVE